jgi:fatty-acyl-CoA synthase
LGAAVVIATAGAKWQEVPVACIVRRAGAEADPAEIEQFCLKELARYKVPRRYVFLDDLPRNALGKVQHFRLTQQIAAD